MAVATLPCTAWHVRVLPLLGCLVLVEPWLLIVGLHGRGEVLEVRLVASELWWGLRLLLRLLWVRLVCCGRLAVTVEACFVCGPWRRRATSCATLLAFALAMGLPDAVGRLCRNSRVDRGCCSSRRGLPDRESTREAVVGSSSSRVARTVVDRSWWRRCRRREWWRQWWPSVARRSWSCGAYVPDKWGHRRHRVVRLCRVVVGEDALCAGEPQQDSRPGSSAPLTAVPGRLSRGGRGAVGMPGWGPVQGTLRAAGGGHAGGGNLAHSLGPQPSLSLLLLAGYGARRAPKRLTNRTRTQRRGDKGGSPPGRTLTAAEKLAGNGGGPGRGVARSDRGWEGDYPVDLVVGVDGPPAALSRTPSGAER